MTILVEKEYLTLPFSSTVARPRVLRFLQEGALLDDIRIRLDYENPQYNAYYPIGRYKGQQIIVEVSPDMELCNIQTDEPDYSAADRYPFRPDWHFTARVGWNNDPNGLLEYTSPVSGEKTYHLFYQYNPYDTIWNNMHWGHAVSSDLMHWKRLPIALFPDETGWMYSGSAIVDKENRSGLKDGPEDVILLYYTCAGGSSERSAGAKFAQGVAWSTDGGYTFHKYAGNPILPHIMEREGDPKVVWCEEIQKYVMALFQSYESCFALFTSSDLLHWEKLQDIFLPGDGECPNFYPLAVDGDPKDVKWVLSGARFKYRIFAWNGIRFQPIQKEVQNLHYGPCNYAAQTFSGISDGRCITMAWERSIDFPEPAPFWCQMSIPQELTLKKRQSRYVLCARPVQEIEQIYESTEACADFVVEPGKCYETELDRSAYDISLTVNGYGAEAVQMELFGYPIEINWKEDKVYFQRNTAQESAAPLGAAERIASLRIIVDRCSMELFAGDGAAVLTVQAICDYNLRSFRICSDTPVTVEKLAVHKLKKNAMK